MYTILLNETNELITSVKERIMQRSKLVDNLHFLVDPIYKGLDMTDFTVMMEYLLPISREYKTEILVKSDTMYKEKLEYKLPLDTNLTKEHGNVELQLTFIKVELGADGTSTQMVRKTSPTVLTILPISAWSDIIADSALTALDQRLIQTQAMLEAVNDMNMYLNDNKADDISYDKETQTLQLMANGKLIGEGVNIGYVGTSVVSIEVDESGNMIVNYSNGNSENIGKAGSGSCVGIYIPSYSEDGVMRFTLKNDAEEPVYEFDIDRSNDWTEIDGIESKTNYIWEEL